MQCCAFILLHAKCSTSTTITASTRVKTIKLPQSLLVYGIISTFLTVSFDDQQNAKTNKKLSEKSEIETVWHVMQSIFDLSILLRFTAFHQICQKIKLLSSVLRAGREQLTQVYHFPL